MADLGARFMMQPETFARGAALGFKPGLGFYLIGRLGVIGTAPAAVATSAAVFINPAYLSAQWTEALATTTTKKATALFSKICQEYGKAHLPNGKRTKRLAELAGKVVDSADVANAPLVAGWRSLPRGRNAAGEAYQLANILRELRMARHAVAVQAEGLTPLEAILSGPGGAGNARMFGWPEPYPSVDSLAERRAAAEDRTDQLVAKDLEVLNASERAELVKLAIDLHTKATK